MNIQKFYETLFEPGEYICWTTDIKGTRVFAVEDYALLNTKNFFCINPLLDIDKNPSQSWHSTFVGRRADCNVTSYRNILLEFDVGTIHEQRELLKDVPYSTLVFSGGKSLHAIISLQEPCNTLQEYKQLAKQIYFKFGDKIDKSTSNPSRLSRSPNAHREWGAYQTLMEVRSRVSRAELEAWLGPIKPLETPQTVEGTEWLRVLNPWTKSYLEFGAEPGTRNSTLFKASCDMFRAGYSYEEILDKVLPIADLPEHEVLTCITSARTAVGPLMHDSITNSSD